MVTEMKERELKKKEKRKMENGTSIFHERIKMTKIGHKYIKRL